MDEPAEYPDGGEPEDYVLKRRHSPALAREMGAFYELRGPLVAQVQRTRPIVSSTRELRLVRDSVCGLDFFGSEDVGYLFASEAAKSWLEKQAPGMVRFEAIRTV